MARKVMIVVENGGIKCVVTEEQGEPVEVLLCDDGRDVDGQEIVESTLYKPKVVNSNELLNIGFASVDNNNEAGANIILDSLNEMERKSIHPKLRMR